MPAAGQYRERRQDDPQDDLSAIPYGSAAFDRRLRAGIPDTDLAQLADLLDRLLANTGAGVDGSTR